MSNPTTLTWETINYNIDLPKNYLVPPHHWPELEKNSLDENLKIKLNHHLTYFMCEMFIHFEKSIIHYMENNKIKLLSIISQNQFDKFIKEESFHIQAFENLAKKIRPDYFSNNSPIFLSPSKIDLWISKYSPISVFFMMAYLFEEMTIFVSEVMEENLEQCFQPALEVMELHKKEEKGHVGIDKKILDYIKSNNNNFFIRIEMLLLLPLIKISDLKVAKAWRKSIFIFAVENNLSKNQTKELLNKGLSKSDKLGIQSFLSKLNKSSFPGTGLLKFALKIVSK